MTMRVFGAPRAISRLETDRAGDPPGGGVESPPSLGAADDGTAIAIDVVNADMERVETLRFPLRSASVPDVPVDVENKVESIGDEGDERFPPRYFDVKGADAALDVLRATSSVSIDVGLSRLSTAPASPAGPPAAPIVIERRRALADVRGRVPDGATGAGVGVVIVDEGVSAAYLHALTGRNPFGGGWQLIDPDPQNARATVGRFADPYRRRCDGHGNMVARNVLSLAPEATIYDAPILPPRVTDVTGFASGATAVLIAVLATILAPHHFGFAHERWVIVNAWGVANSFADPHSRSTDRRGYMRNRDHMLNGVVHALAALDHVDVVFAAGNAGEHAPDPHSGPYDCGRHRSVSGANALSEVVTVGAATSGSHQIAASSQEPCAIEMLADPDAPKVLQWMPSWFVEDHDASILNTGTSAAAAIHAGYVASCRSAGVAPVR